MSEAHPDRRRLLLLTLTWGGQLFYLGTEAVDLDDGKGGTLPVLGTLDPIMASEVLDLFNTQSFADSIPVEFALPDVGVCARVVAGHPLSKAVGELARVFADEAYTGREEILTGRLRAPEYDSDGVIRASIEVVPRATPRLLPDPDVVITEDEWSSFAETSAGRVGQIVFGRPGVYVKEGGTLQGVPATPAYLVERVPDEVFVIAYHKVAATVVEVFNTEDGVSQNLPVTHVTDASGRTAAVATRVSATAWQPDDGYWVGWTQLTSGALYDEEIQGPLLAAGSVLRWLLQRAGGAVDLSRTRVAERMLQGILLSGYMDTPTEVWPFLESEILPLLPVSIVSGPEGAFPLVWDLTTDVHDALPINIDLGDGEAVGPIRDADDEPPNTLRVSAVLDGGRNVYTRTLTLGTGVEGADSSHASRIAYQRDGELREVVLETAYLYDRASQRRVCHHLMRRYGTTGTEVTYQLRPGFEGVRRGRAVALTHGRRSFKERLGWVTEVETPPSGQVQVTVWLKETVAGWKR